MSEFIAHVVAELDSSKAISQLNAITSKKYKLQFENFDSNYFTKNLDSEMTKAGKSAGTSFNKSFSQALSGNSVNNQFTNLNKNIAQTQKNLNNVNAHGLNNVVGAVTKYFSAYRMIAVGLREVKDGFRFVNDLDDAMTNISYTMDVGADKLQSFSQQAVQMAKDLHTSAKTVLEASTLYANANETLESIMAKTQTATMLSNVTGMSGEKSAKTLQAVMNQFDLTQDDLLIISDTMQSISQSMAYDFAGGINEIASGISTAGSVAADAGVSLAEFSSMIGTIVEQSNASGSQAGNALKTIFTRITKASESAGTVTEDISKAEEAFRSVGIEVRSSSGEFREVDQILGDLAEKWDSLSGVEQSKISFEAAGTRQRNILGSLLKSWDLYEERVENATNLEDSPTLKNQEKYAESMTGHLEELSASVESFWATFIDTKSAKSAVDMFTGIIKLLEKTTKTFGSLGTIGAGLTLFSLFKNRSYFSTMASTLADSEKNLSNFGAAAKMAGADFASFLKTPAGAISAIGAVTAVIGVAVQAYQNYQQELRETREAQLEESQAAIEGADAFEDAYVLASRYAGKTSLTADEESKFQAVVEGASEALGSKAGAFDAATGSAQTYLETLQSVSAETLKQAKVDATKERSAAEKLLQSDSWSDWSGSKVTIDLSGRTGVDEFMEAKGVLEDLMATYVDLGTYGDELEPLNWDSDTSNMDAVVDYYYQLINLQNELADKNLTNNDIYDDSSKIINALKEDIDAYTKAKYDELKYTYEVKNGIPTTVEEYNAMQDAILGNIDASEEYKDVISGMMDKDFADTIDFDAVAADAENATEAIANGAANATSSLAQLSDKANKVVDSIKSVQGVLNTQTTGESMSLDDWNAEELKDYRGALEYVNGALQLNADKVNEIVKAKGEEQIEVNNTNKAYAQSKYLSNAAEIEKLRAKIRDNTFAQDENANSVQAQIDTYLAENSTLKDTINSYDLMNASITEATSAYQNWLNAQNAAQSGDMFDSSIEAMKKINDTLNDAESDSYGRIGNKDYQAAVDFIVPESVDHDDTEAVNKYMKSISDLFTYDENGARNGLDINQFCQKAVDAGLMILDDASGEYKVAGEKTMQDFADGLGLALPLVQAMFGEMEEFGASFDWSDEASKTIGDLGVNATEAAEKLRSIEQFSDLKIQMDVSGIENTEDKLSALDATIEEMQEVKAKVPVDSSEAQYANQVIEYCLTQKQLLSQPEVMKVDTSMVEGKIGEAIGLLQQFQQAQEQLETAKALGIDTSQAQANLDAVTQKIQGLDENVTTTLSVDTTSIDTIQQSISSLTCEMLVKAGVDDTAIIGFQSAEHDAKGTVDWTNDTAAVDAYSAAQKASSGTVKWYNDTSLVKTRFTASGTINWTNSGGHQVNGTAHAGGTAKVGGDWGTAIGGSTLVGELGQEIVVDPHTGRWYTVGDNGAEFANIPKGAIVFNHLQSKSLLENGYAVGRATALAWGTAAVTGGIKVSQAQKSSAYNAPVKSKSSKGNTSTKSYNKSKDNAKDFEESFDWVEIALNRISQAIDRLKIKAESVFKSLSKKNTAASDEIAMITEQIDLQNQAYDQYMKQANAVGLSSEWQQKVKNGSIEFSTIKDEDLAEKIKDFQKYYEAAVECKDAVAELHEEIAQLYKDKFDNIAEKYQGELSLMEHLTNVYQTGIDSLVTRGYIGSTQYYDSLIAVEKENIGILKNELKLLKDAYSDAMNSGEIEEGSLAWYEMQQEINDTKEAIEEAQLNMEEFAKSARELSWEFFDFTQERISSVTSEAEFLIDLLDNGKLFDDNGNMTDAGLSTMGLHGQNYNVYMAQADQYRQEVEKLNAELANDPYNTDLLNRREELLKLQQESILAAEDEKQAIVDLVEEGINLELDSLKELISAYTDSLDSAKSLYEYQNKIKNQAAEVANLQKQLSAYQNDTSEENRARIQKITVDLSKAMEELQESEYDQYITDQKKLLDDLYTSYETILNQRLDDVDALVSDMIDTINANSSSIADTISSEASNVGYSLSESMKSIWNNEGGAFAIITKYGENFSTQLTSVNTALSAIVNYVNSLIAKSDAEAKEKEEATKPTTPTDKPNTPPPSNPTPPKPTPAPPQKTIKVGGKINAGSAKIYDYAGDTSGERQYFRNDPIYTVLDEKSGYLKVRHHKLSSGVTGWFKKGDVKAYATGLREAKKDETAWVNELGSESILSPTKQAIITHVSKGDTILDAEATKNIWDMANDPSEFISSNAWKTGGFANGNDTNNNYNVQIDNTFDLPNVMNYEDFCNRMCRDSKYEKMILSMVMTRFNKNASRLDKCKYQW